ncbi:MAG: sigma factor-like helix-turn-helix DNA-binding protein [Nannocystaceae bacterium]
MPNTTTADHDLDRDLDLDDPEQGLDAADDLDADVDADADDEGPCSGDPRPIVRRARAKTIAMKRLTKEELRIGALLYPERSYWRPKTRGECANVSRPCPYVSCKYHLYIDVNPSTGSIKINFPDLEVWELSHSCALDVASQGGITLEEVGEILNLTRERIRQVEVRGLLKLREAGGEDMLSYLSRGE